ncbi:HSPB1-associated protein 1 isoform X2 [Achroia grisella]|uniref:HSPB1-associated protein 1 isoform X2 n=1 Tax=Achroia grisella TaxID=688607 RepID=UPI0027D2ECE5|nr:HSPB1-associated protein 1 isoform X2 [Achroia grisella]
MSTVFNEDTVRNLTRNVNVPLVFRKYISNWPICQWNIDKWSTVFGDRQIPFRCMRKDFVSDEPCWERQCKIKSMTFKNFLDGSSSSNEWMYFDYKYLHQWFNADTELYKEVSWNQFGYAEKGATDSTLWVGSSGAHTPAHQDTYGINIVAQLYGTKRWILFPPETGGLKPTRVPYEESSVYSALNFYCPNNMDVFNGLTGGRMVELAPGDALLVPRGWWHYVQNTDCVNIALNVWLPHDDIADTPLAVLFLQLETVANIYLDKKRKLRRVKRQRTCEEDTTVPIEEEYDLKSLLDEPTNNLELAPSITSADLTKLLKDNLAKYVNTNRSFDEDEVDGTTNNLCLTKAVIDAFSQSNVIDLVKQNLLARLS